MPRFEITFATSNPNAEDPNGLWYNYYTASSQDEAIFLFATDIYHMKNSIEWFKVIDISIIG